MKKLLYVLMLVLLVPLVYAHEPIFSYDSGNSPANPVILDNIDKSQVIYADMSSEKQLWITFDAKEGQTLYVQVGVPKLDKYARFRPTVAVQGPNFFSDSLPFSPPFDSGTILDNSENPVVSYDTFSGTESWILSENRLTVTKAGKHYILAFSEEQGKIWIAVGEKEEFGLNDLSELPSVVGEVRAFHELEGTSPFIIASGTAIALVVLAVVYLIYRLARKRKKQKRLEHQKQKKEEKKHYQYKAK